MLARFSKCDFWIPGQILDFENVVSKKKRFRLQYQGLSQESGIDRGGLPARLYQAFLIYMGGVISRIGSGMTSVSKLLRADCQG